jgi:hypothetical protein
LCRLSPLNAASGTKFLQLCSFSHPGIVKSEASPEIPAHLQAFAANSLFKLKKPAVLQFCRGNDSSGSPSSGSLHTYK